MDVTAVDPGTGGQVLDEAAQAALEEAFGEAIVTVGLTITMQMLPKFMEQMNELREEA